MQRTGTPRLTPRVDSKVQGGSTRKTLVQNLVAYAIAVAIICYAARGVSWTDVIDATGQASPWIFVLASLGGFLCCFLGQTILYSRLFSYFHGPTGAIELLPTMAAVYFLQIVNSWVAGGAFVLFLHARKRAPALAVPRCTLMFQADLDATLLAAMALLAIIMVPSSPLRLGLDYAIGVLGASCLIGSYFLLWGARFSAEQLAPLDLTIGLRWRRSGWHGRRNTSSCSASER